MILGLLSFVIANVAVLCVTQVIVRRIETRVPSTTFVVFLLIRLTLISFVVWIAGLTRTLDSSFLGMLGGITLVALGITGGYKGLVWPKCPPLGLFAWILIGVLVVRLVAQVWFFTPHLGDAVAYHLPKVAEWVQTGGFTSEMGLHPHVTFPAGFELVETWWVLFLGHDVLIEMAGVEFLVLGYAATYSLGRFFGLSEGWSGFAALLYVLTPGLHLSATSCLNDAPVAGLVVATFALLLWRVPIPLVLMAMGIGLGVKPTYGFAIPGFLLAWWWMRREPGLSVPSKWIPVGLAVAGIAVGSWWYVRNVHDYGNPFYPLGNPEVHNPAAVQLGPSLQSLPENVLDLVNVRIYDNKGAYGANVDNIAGWGSVAFACGIIALIVAVRSDPKFRLLASAFVLSLCSTLIFVRNDLWCLKYVFFFPCVLCLATARLASAHKNVLAIAYAGVAFSFLGTFFPYDLQFSHFKTLYSQSWQERSSLVFREPDITEDRVACFGGFNAFSYTLYRPDFSRDVEYLRSQSADELLEEMEARGTHFLYAAPDSREQMDILSACLARGTLERVGGRLYRISP